MIKTELSNGLRVVLEKMSTLRSVSFGIWVKTGSRFETEVNNGISHFIEHMLFKGTDRFGAKEIAEVFDGIGGNVNAFTSKEYTCYYAKVLDEHLPIAVDLLADMFFNSKFDPEDLDKERNVILEEIAMYEDTPDDLVHDLLAEAAYGNHALGYTILGKEANLRSLSASDLKGYLAERYRIKDIVISVAGNYPDTIMELLEKHFGSFTGEGQELTGSKPDFLSSQAYSKKKTEQNHICLALPGLALNDKRLYAMILLNNAIGGGMSSRLFQEIREKRGLAYSVYSYHSAHEDSGMFTVYTGTAPKQTEEVLKLTEEVLADVIAKGLTDKELKQGKEQLKGSLILGLESSGSRMNRIGKNELMLGRHFTLDETIGMIEAVTMEDVRLLTAELFSNPFALAMVGQSDKAIRAFRRDNLVKA